MSTLCRSVTQTGTMSTLYIFGNRCAVMSPLCRFVVQTATTMRLWRTTTRCKANDVLVSGEKKISMSVKILLKLHVRHHRTHFHNFSASTSNLHKIFIIASRRQDTLQRCLYRRKLCVDLWRLWGETPRLGCIQKTDILERCTTSFFCCFTESARGGLILTWSPANCTMLVTFYAGPYHASS